MLNKLKAWCKHSETIFVARSQMLIGALLVAITQVDPNLFIGLVGAKWFPIFLIAHGAIVEILRRRGDPEMNRGRGH